MKGPAMALHSPGSLNAASGGMAYSADPEEERGEDEMNFPKGNRNLEGPIAWRRRRAGQHN